MVRRSMSTSVIDRAGLLRFHAFGAVDDFVLGATIGRFLADGSGEPVAAPAARSPRPTNAGATGQV